MNQCTSKMVRVLHIGPASFGPLPTPPTHTCTRPQTCLTASSAAVAQPSACGKSGKPDINRRQEPTPHTNTPSLRCATVGPYCPRKCMDPAISESPTLRQQSGCISPTVLGPQNRKKENELLSPFLRVSKAGRKKNVATQLLPPWGGYITSAVSGPRIGVQQSGSTQRALQCACSMPLDEIS